MSSPRPLTQDVLSTLPDRLAVPHYDRTGLRTGIVHVGVGNFHRAHQAVYIDRLLAEQDASDWAICGLGLRESDARMRDVLAAQDGLYTLLTKHPDGTTDGAVIGSITDYVLATDDAETAVARLAHPDTRIVSLTITEGGYKQMKLRLLNAGHSVLGLLGAVHGYGTIDACVSDPVFAAYLRRFLDVEATPPLAAVEGVDLNTYKESLLHRFGNPAIRDSVSRICSFSSDKLPKFLLPTIRANLASGGSIDYATVVVAAWCYYSDKQASKTGEPLDIRDPLREELHRAASATNDDVLAFVRLEAVFEDLSRSEVFAERYADMVRRVYDASDVRECMAAVV